MADNTPKVPTPEEKAAILAAEQNAKIAELTAALAAKSAPPPAEEGAKDETVPGGAYLVNGIKVDAEGKAIKED